MPIWTTDLFWYNGPLDSDDCIYALRNVWDDDKESRKHEFYNLDRQRETGDPVYKLLVGYSAERCEFTIELLRGFPAVFHAYDGWPAGP